MVKMLIKALVNGALEEGTSNWDLTMSKASSVLLLSALQVRCGDILYAQGAECNTPYLAWKDITLRLGEHDLEGCYCRVRIRNEKWHK